MQIPNPVQLPPLPKCEKPTSIVLPIVLPIIDGFDTPTPPSTEVLQKAYDAVYSDENSEKTESESETLDTITLDTIEEPTTIATVDSTEPVTEETVLQQTVIEGWAYNAKGHAFNP